MKIVGTSALVIAPENFSYYRDKITGVFFFLGFANPDKDTDNPHRSTRFIIGDNILKSVGELLAELAADHLAGKV